MTSLARTLSIVVVVSVALAAGALTARQWLRPAAPVLVNALAYATPRPLPAFALVDQQGIAFDRARLLGRWSLLFFGFTHCPDVCPGTLTMLAAVAKSLDDLPPAQRPQVVFVSVDPERDTPEVLARYTAFFDASFVGVTGTSAAMAAFARAAGVAVHKGEVVDGTYTVDHTAAIFLVDPQAALAAVLPTPHVAASVAADYRALVSQGR